MPPPVAHATIGHGCYALAATPWPGHTGEERHRPPPEARGGRGPPQGGGMVCLADGLMVMVVSIWLEDESRDGIGGIGGEGRRRRSRGGDG